MGWILTAGGDSSPRHAQIHNRPGDLPLRPGEIGIVFDGPFAGIRWWARKRFPVAPLAFPVILLVGWRAHQRGNLLLVLVVFALTVIVAEWWDSASRRSRRRHRWQICELRCTRALATIVRAEALGWWRSARSPAQFVWDEDAGPIIRHDEGSGALRDSGLHAIIRCSRRGRISSIRVGNDERAVTAPAFGVVPVGGISHR